MPANAAHLVKLPGVGKLTATVVLSDAFGLPGVAVHTTVSRLVLGLGLVSPKATPVQIQSRLTTYMPKSTWIKLHRSYIRFGRTTLRARHPQPHSGPTWTFLATTYAHLKGTTTTQIHLCTPSVRFTVLAGILIFLLSPKRFQLVQLDSAQRWGRFWFRLLGYLRRVITARLVDIRLDNRPVL